jgi:hypothetical protein
MNNLYCSRYTKNTRKIKDMIIFGLLNYEKVRKVANIKI